MKLFGGAGYWRCQYVGFFVAAIGVANTRRRIFMALHKDEDGFYLEVHRTDLTNECAPL